MATRCTYGFYKNNKLKMDYNHYDSYPTGFGVLVVNFIRENSIQELHELFDKIILVNRYETPTIEQKSILLKHNIKHEHKEWKNILRSDAEFLVNYKRDMFFMLNYNDWFLSGQDWAYLINLDTELFEVYKHRFDGDPLDPIDINKYNQTYTLTYLSSLSKIDKTWNLDL